MAVIKEVIKYEGTVFEDAAKLRGALEGHEGKVMVLHKKGIVNGVRPLPAKKK